MLLGSMSIAPIIKETKQKLEKNGFDVLVISDLDHMIANPGLTDSLDEDYEHCIENDILGEAFDSIKASDCVLVLNYPKNGIDGYCGTSVCMELAVAYHLRKKIYLLHPLPSYHDHRWALEVAILQPIIINGDLSKIDT
jgi:hypothetical protein